MGMRFDIRSANWVAYLIQPDAPLPRLHESWEEIETLRIFLRKVKHQFFSSPWVEEQFHRMSRNALHILDDIEHDFQYEKPIKALLSLREFLGKRSWTALIIPSGSNYDIDNYLCSEKYLRDLVSIRCEDPGLILQMEDMPNEPFSLTDVFPAFKIALAESTQWPGILLWTVRGDSVFMPFGSTSKRDIDEKSHWIFSHLATALHIEPATLLNQYKREFPHVSSLHSDVINFIHMSDIHVGSKESRRRLPRVQQLIASILTELDDRSKIVPVISGDLMDTPDDQNLDGVRSFINFVENLGAEEPVVVLGNHDVRKGGFLTEDLKHAMKLPTNRVVWLENEGVGLICLNSVTDGSLARGHIGEQQFIDVGNELDRKNFNKEHILLSLMHHHPTPVDYPDWYSRPFYEKLFGDRFDKTLELEDSPAFLSFAENRNIKAVLHGHKHIPRVSEANNMTIIGCGSTVGKVATTEAGTFMSINVVSLDLSKKQLSVRLLAERIPGGGLVEYKRHEVVYRKSISN